MKPQSNVIRKSRGTIVALSGMALALGLAAVPTQADEWNKRTILTISQPMQVRDTYLEPGQYVFKLLDSQSDRHIVEIYNADQNHLIATIMAIPDYRVQVTGKSSFRMWETPAGYVGALRSWYYPGDNFGQEFPYPKNLKQIAFNQTSQVITTPAPPVAEPAPAEPAPQPQAFAPEPPSQQAPVEIAQNSPPPAPAPEPAVETPAPPQPTVLPKTAGSYPLFGLTGLLLLALGGLLRYARWA